MQRDEELEQIVQNIFESDESASQSANEKDKEKANGVISVLRMMASVFGLPEIKAGPIRMHDNMGLCKCTVLVKFKTEPHNSTFIVDGVKIFIWRDGENDYKMGAQIIFRKLQEKYIGGFRCWDWQKKTEWMHPNNDGESLNASVAVGDTMQFCRLVCSKISNSVETADS